RQRPRRVAAGRRGGLQLIECAVLRRRVGRSHIPAKFLVRSGVYAPPASVSSPPAVYTNFHLRILQLRSASRRGLAKASTNIVRVVCWRGRRGAYAVNCYNDGSVTAIISAPRWAE